MSALPRSFEHEVDTSWGNAKTPPDPVAEDLSRHIEFTDEQMDASGHAQVANRWRDVYMAGGFINHKNTALRHYEIALSAEDNEHIHEAWILCNRLNLYLHEYSAGRLPAETIDEQIALASAAAGSSRNLLSMRLRSQTLAWLGEVKQLMLGPAGADTEVLPALGGLATHASGNIVLEPEPVISPLF